METSKVSGFDKVLEREVKFQENLIKIAIQGIGEFELAPKFQYLKIKETVWERKSEHEKDSILKKKIMNSSIQTQNWSHQPMVYYKSLKQGPLPLNLVRNKELDPKKHIRSLQ